MKKFKTVKVLIEETYFKTVLVQVPADKSDTIAIAEEFCEELCSDEEINVEKDYDCWERICNGDFAETSDTDCGYPTFVAKE